MLPPVPGSPAFPGSHAMAWPGSHLRIPASGKKIRIIGLNTSYREAFAKALNSATTDASYNGYRVTAAYPCGSKKIASSYNRIPGYIEKVKGTAFNHANVCVSISRWALLLTRKVNNTRVNQSCIVFD